MVLCFSLALTSASVLDRICGMSCAGEISRAALSGPQEPISCHEPEAATDRTRKHEPPGPAPCGDHDSPRLVAARETASPASTVQARAPMAAAAAGPVAGDSAVGMTRRSEFASLYGPSPPRRLASVLRI